MCFNAGQNRGKSYAAPLGDLMFDFNQVSGLMPGAKTCRHYRG